MEWKTWSRNLEVHKSRNPPSPANFSGAAVLNRCCRFIVKSRIDMDFLLPIFKVAFLKDELQEIETGLLNFLLLTAAQ